MFKVSSKKILVNLLLLIALKWTVVGAVAAIAMMSMKAAPTENSVYSNAE